ncbi:MAG: ATP-binding cassette domain-containing protein [Myxococcaceae bacterium]|nr:ATP-binding cassette domain-containing protein [Myxococcaceae bacterium]
MKIDVSEIEKSFQKTRALSRVSLSIESGSMHGIIGPEGAGKTTLLRIMLHLLKSDQPSRILGSPIPSSGRRHFNHFNDFVHG